MPRPLRIAFFGGTFDPIHEGHLEIARKARVALQLDQVLLIPCRQSPHKKEAPGASDQERLKMAHLGTNHLPWVNVSAYEIERPPPSYTWETVRKFKNQFPKEARLFLLIGLDQWEALPRWKHPERLAADLDFIVVGREGTPTPRPGYRAHFIKGNHPASSSQIRQELASGLEPKWLPQPVQIFVQKKGLYSVTP